MPIAITNLTKALWQQALLLVMSQTQIYTLRCHVTKFRQPAQNLSILASIATDATLN